MTKKKDLTVIKDVVIEINDYGKSPGSVGKRVPITWNFNRSSNPIGHCTIKDDKESGCYRGDFEFNDSKMAKDTLEVIKTGGLYPAIGGRKLGNEVIEIQQVSIVTVNIDPNIPPIMIDNKREILKKKEKPVVKTSVKQVVEFSEKVPHKMKASSNDMFLLLKEHAATKDWIKSMEEGYTMDVPMMVSQAFADIINLNESCYSYLDLRLLKDLHLYFATNDKTSHEHYLFKCIDNLVKGSNLTPKSEQVSYILINALRHLDQEQILTLYDKLGRRIDPEYLKPPKKENNQPTIEYLPLKELRVWKGTEEHFINVGKFYTHHGVSGGPFMVDGFLKHNGQIRAYRNVKGDTEDLDPDVLVEYKGENSDQYIKELHDAHSMQPAYHYIGKETGIKEFKLEHKMVDGDRFEIIRAYNHDGQLIREWWPSSVNISYGYR